MLLNDALKRKRLSIENKHKNDLEKKKSKKNIAKQIQQENKKDYQSWYM